MCVCVCVCVCGHVGVDGGGGLHMYKCKPPRKWYVKVHVYL